MTESEAKAALREIGRCDDEFCSAATACPGCIERLLQVIAWAEAPEPKDLDVHLEPDEVKP